MGSTFTRNGLGELMMIQIDMPMPRCCDECFALDDNGDYPFCLISQDQRGYTFNTRNERMPTCPMKEQEPRVLTLEEVKNDCPDYVYIETFTGWFECVIQDAGESDKYCGVFVYGIDEDFWENWTTYGKEWRCWTARPTDEQREVTQWME